MRLRKNKLSDFDSCVGQLPSRCQGILKGAVITSWDAFEATEPYGLIMQDDCGPGAIAEIRRWAWRNGQHLLLKDKLVAVVTSNGRGDPSYMAIVGEVEP